MTFVVPFDGSAAAEAALVRARDIGDAVGDAVLVIAVIPVGNAAYARERGWVGPSDPFDLDAVVATLREQVHDIAPDATFEYERCSRSVSGNAIAKPIRKFAKRNGASMVFVGSDDAGRLVTTLASVGGRIITDAAYDVVLVRTR